MPHPSPTELERLSDDLVALATLGTERRPVALPAVPGPLGPALAQATAQPAAEQALLSSASVLLRYRQAGRRAAQHTHTLMPPAEAEQRPRCSTTALHQLQLMLAGTYRGVLPEWLEHANRAGQRVPVALLPEVLGYGSTNPEVRSLVAAVVGNTGRWLAGQNPQWRYAIVGSQQQTQTSEQIQNLWETGTRSVRVALLSRLRQTQPARARDLIAAVWAKEKADERAALLEPFQAGLSMDDETWLESLLDDRSKEVRQQAARMLQRLPESRYTQRMLQRVAALLAWTPPQSRRLLGLVQGKPGSIVVTLPAECDKAMQRDGIDPKEIGVPGQGERGQWLYQLVRGLAPSVLAHHWQASPTDILNAAVASDSAKLLLPGFGQAAERTADQRWAEVLLRQTPAQHSLFPLLTLAQQEALLLELLGGFRGPLDRSGAFGLLTMTEHQWSPELTRQAATTLVRFVQSKPQQVSYHLHAVVQMIGIRMPIQLRDVEALLAGLHNEIRKRHGQSWDTLFETTLDTIQFRRAVAEAFREVSE